jgi:hypothetical protein
MRKSSVFISLTGEYPNIGDGLIRRVALDWVRSQEGVTALFADAPQSWIGQMRLEANDRAVIGRWATIRWIVRLIISRDRPVLVMEPGELSLARYNFPRECRFLVLSLIVRARRGVVVLPPRAITRRNEARAWPPTLVLHRQSARLAQVCLWRDQWSQDQIGVGVLVPDTAFGADLRVGESVRRVLAVSMRGKREQPSAAWFAALRDFATQHDLEIVTFAQVETDQQRAVELAEGLGGCARPWVAGSVGEQSLRDFYDSAAIVVSDRLHVLIISALSGAIPVEVAPTPSGKVTSHFATIGLEGVSFDSSSATRHEILDFLDARWKRGAPIREVSAAHDRVTEIAAMVNSAALGSRGLRDS